ncbi:MAG: protein kinase [Xanthomonadales bacterium]|nr:protein kinase [Xanthomonadales bacterium]
MDDTPRPTPPADAPAISGYRIARKLGQGGMATVWLAVQESLDRQVAIKVMLPLASMDEQQARRFEHEARTIARLEHPHIVNIYEVGRTSEGRLYYVMAYLPRGDLSHRDLSRDQPAVLALLRALLGALSYAHARGVVHRDVKAENVLFDADDRPMLADFGIALSSRVVTRLTNAGMTLGSGGYMAPEQSRGEPVDARADLYSVGVLAYELLVGELPYQANDPLALAMMHGHDPIPRLPRHLRHWQPFIDRAMAKSPSRRHRNAEAMRSALDAVEKRMNGAGASLDERWHRLISNPVWRATWLKAAFALALLAVLLAVLLRPDAPPAPSVTASGSEAATAPSPVPAVMTSVTQPVDPAELQRWLQRLQDRPDDADAIAGVSRQIEWLGEQAELDLAAGDDEALLARQRDAQTLRGRAGNALQPALDRFERRLRLLLLSRQRQSLLADDREENQRVRRLLIEMGLGSNLDLPADSPIEYPLLAAADAAPAASPASGSPSANSGKGKPATGGRFVTRSEYAAFVQATGRADSRCRARLSPLRLFDRRSWKDPGFEQKAGDPVVCVSAEDAAAYLAWASRRDGRQYQLPSASQRPQNRLGLAEWTNRCIASSDGKQVCERRIAAGPLAQRQELDPARGYDGVTFRLQSN